MQNISRSKRFGKFVLIVYGKVTEVDLHMVTNLKNQSMKLQFLNRTEHFLFLWIAHSSRKSKAEWISSTINCQVNYVYNLQLKPSKLEM